MDYLLFLIRAEFPNRFTRYVERDQVVDGDKKFENCMAPRPRGSPKTGQS